MDDIPPEAHNPYFFKNGCRFSLVAMVTRLGLLLVKPCAKRNSITNYCSTFKFGRVVHKNNTHKNMKPDFFCGCHGNREPTNQDIYNHNSNLKIDIRNPASWFCSPKLAYHLCKISWLYDFSFLSYVWHNVATLRILLFWDINENIF